MNSAKDVGRMVEEWKAEGRSRTEIIVGSAEAEIGWPYVWGATGQACTPAKRKACAARSNCPAKEKTEILEECQVTRQKNPQADCAGCEWFPDGGRVQIDDCQGFIKQTAGRAGIKFTGGGCTTMWAADSNWAAKGPISTLPEQLCCVFWTDSKKPNTKSHIGWYIGGGWMIHCSGKVKKEKLSAKCTDWAIPAGLEGGGLQVTLRRGSSGEAVTELQTMLIRRGYDVGKTGADGKYGAKTEAAVKQFQRDAGLTADGIAGPKTLAALQAEQESYTVTVQHLSRNVAEEIIRKYGGSMTKE